MRCALCGIFFSFMLKIRSCVLLSSNAINLNEIPCELPRGKMENMIFSHVISCHLHTAWIRFDSGATVSSHISPLGLRS